MTEATIKRDKQSIGLWKKISKKGKPYLSGSSDRYWISVFKNTLKENEVEPDNSVLFTPKNPEDTDITKYSVGLFKRVSKRGTEYAAGRRGAIAYALFPNTRKTPGSNQPDYNLSIEVAITGSQPIAYNRQHEGVNHLPEEEEKPEPAPPLEQEGLFDPEDPGVDDTHIPYDDEDDIPF